jgi:hypothetical protein
MVIDLEIEIGDPATEAGLHILIDSPEGRKELERRSIPTDLEQTHEDSKSITKMPHKITSVAHAFPTKT